MTELFVTTKVEWSGHFCSCRNVVFFSCVQIFITTYDSIWSVKHLKSVYLLIEIMKSIMVCSSKQSNWSNMFWLDNVHLCENLFLCCQWHLCRMRTRQGKTCCVRTNAMLHFNGYSSTGVHEQSTTAPCDHLNLTIHGIGTDFPWGVCSQTSQVLGQRMCCPFCGLDACACMSEATVRSGGLSGPI